MPALSDFVELSLNGLEIDSVSWQAPRLTANFGDGYGATAIVGSAAGLHRWVLSSGALPDADNYGNLINSLPRFEYYFEFIKLHTTTKEIFQIEYRGKNYHASFVNNNFDAEMLTLDLFSTEGVEIKQRRVEGIVYDTDGSIFIVPNTPGLWGWWAADFGWDNLEGTWVDQSGNEHDLARSGSNQVTKVDDVQNGLPVIRLNNTLQNSWLSSFASPVATEFMAVMKMREATFAANVGIWTTDAVIGGVAPLIGDSAETKFQDVGIGATWEYRLNGVVYPENNQQAPMNAFGIVHGRFDEPGITMLNMQFGKDRDNSGSFAQVDFGEMLVGTDTWSEATVNRLTRYLASPYRWNISI